ncbi:MAG: GIY-YIG nuclease family protein [Atribacterota bacterium]|jgi:hypothetical protein|nr:GIY-YIG nuclease family protein [Atribacterota bacterium]MDD4896112.1 GIY-YIG nuclease family protein [Atribacterota bacterium]MDD5637320.1 GIY-YIG nuclease family protein [Atribacterota bacterium]
MNRKKELKLQYKLMKPKMGIFAIRSKVNKKCYIEAAKDLKSRINMTNFKLELGSHPIKTLQEDWKKFGKDSFSLEILEELKYYEDEAKTDYQDELSLLQLIWAEKLLQENYELYEK